MALVLMAEARRCCVGRRCSMQLAGIRPRWSPGRAAGSGAALAASWRGAGARVVVVARERRGGSSRSWRGSARGRGGARAGRGRRRRGRDLPARRGGDRARRADRPAGPQRQHARAACRCALLLDTECEDFARVLEVNLVGPFRLTKAVVGSMARARPRPGRGRQLRRGGERLPGLGRLRRVEGRRSTTCSRTWAAELAESGVRFLSVDPGEMDTQMHADAMPGRRSHDARRPG